MSLADPKPPLEAFLEQYWKDRETVRVRQLHEYLALFPGDDDAIAVEFLGLQRGGSDRMPPVAGAQLGNYRIIRELGRGGQATVYLAEDTTLGRQVALKVLEGVGPAQEEVLARFRREALAASALQHPGICAVYEAKVDARVPYIAMQYVEGETLARRIATTRERLTPDTENVVVAEAVQAPPSAPDSITEVRPLDRSGILEAVQLVEKAARAVHSAHEAGIIHRDIKPGNIMMSRNGDPVILDFGLAWQEDTGLSTLTRTGDLFGTPAYMSPEQITRQSIRLDRRTDVWSLGVVLYECLTMRRPFEAPTRESLYQSILTKDPLDLRRLNRGIPKDLRVVVQTAIEKDRDRRYQTAVALADDLRRVANSEPILARPPGIIGRTIRWTRRRPGRAAAAALVILLLATALVLGIAWLQEAYSKVVLVQQIAERWLSSVAREAAVRIDHQVEGMKDLVRSWADDGLLVTEIAALNRDPVDQERTRQLTLILEQRLRYHEDLVLLMVVRRDGVIGAETHRQAAEGSVSTSHLEGRNLREVVEDNTERNWIEFALSPHETATRQVKVPVSTRDFHVSELLSRARGEHPLHPGEEGWLSPGRTVLGFATSLMPSRHDQAVGALVAVFDWSCIRRLLMELEARFLHPASGSTVMFPLTTMLLAGDGNSIFFHHRQEFLGSSLLREGLGQLSTLVRNGSQGTGTSSMDGRLAHVVAFDQTSAPERGGFGWILVVGFEANAIVVVSGWR